jgi:DTW domain-containing protein YfiP
MVGAATIHKDSQPPTPNITKACPTATTQSTGMTSNDKNSSSLHKAQWERRATWLSHLREEKQRLQSSGVEGFDLLEQMASLSIKHKLATQKDRCEKCWHTRLHCICSRLESFVMHKCTGSLDVNIFILMHHKEFMSAGNSAKLILQLFPYATKLYIFGREGDIDLLFRDINSNNSKSILLWPGKDAISTSTLLEQINAGTSTSELSHKDRATTINAIVLDGTYSQARNMHKSLKKKWGNHLPNAVALRPESESVFHRAKKNYGKAHLQQHNLTSDGHDAVLRVSTAEACGVLFYDLGLGDECIVDVVTKAVEINNDALKFARCNLTEG